jgi:CBS domain-containing protein
MPGGDVKTVREIMQREVVAVSGEATLAEVVQTFAEEGISGAPVLGAGGEVLGVVSATDLIRVVARESELSMGDLALGPADLPAEEYDEEDPGAFYLVPSPRITLPGNDTRGVPVDPLDGYSVTDVMTAAVFSVRPEDPVDEVAAFMLRGRIHRVLVTEGDQLRGLVTTFDLLKVLARDEEEGGSA